MSFETIKTREEFTKQLGLFVTTDKQAWDLMTKLAVSAVEHYHANNHDTSWLKDLYTQAMDIEGGKYHLAIEKLAKESTNVKFRMDVDNLEAGIKAVTSGNVPSEWPTIIASAKLEGIRKYSGQKSARTKHTAARLNNDFVQPKTTKKSTSADITHLEQTELGKLLAEVLKGTSEVEGDILEKAKALTSSFGEQLGVVLSGGELPAESTGSGISGVSSEMSEHINRLVNLASEIEASGSTTLIRKVRNSIDSVVDQLAPAHAKALAALAKQAS